MGNKEAQQKENYLEKVIEGGKVRVELHYRDRFVKSSFANQQNLYLNNSIRFADTKAGALVAANGLITKFVLDLALTTEDVIGYLFKIGFVILLISILFSLIVVYPRKKNSKEKGLIFWQHIKNNGKENYVNAIMDDSDTDLIQTAVENNYYQALILTEKFKQLSLAFKISFLAYLVISLALILKLFILG